MLKPCSYELVYAAPAELIGGGFLVAVPPAAGGGGIIAAAQYPELEI